MSRLALLICIFGLMGCDDPLRVISCNPKMASRIPVYIGRHAPDPSSDDSPLPKPVPDPLPDPKPELKIPPTATGLVGKVIRIKAQTNGANVSWFALDDGLTVFPSSELRSQTTGIMWAVSPGVFRVVAHSAYGNVISEPEECVVTVTLGSPGPVPHPSPPSPNPTPPVPNPSPPNPQPSPVLPPGKYGLAQFTYDNIKSLVPADKQPTCKTLSQNYAVVVAQIAAGTVKTAADANAKLAALNHQTIPATDNAIWSPLFKAMNEKGTSLKIANMVDWQQALTEFGQGFAAAGGG